MKKITSILLATILILSLASCANSIDPDVLGEIASASEGLEEIIPVPTITPTEAPDVIENPNSILESIDSVEIEEDEKVENIKEVENDEQYSKVTTTSEPMTDENITNSANNSNCSLEQRTPEEEAAMQQAAIENDLNNLLAQAAFGSSNSSSSNSTNNRSASGITAESTANTSNENANSGSASNTNQSSKSEGTDSDGIVSTPTSAETPTPTQHTHSYAWVESGSTRVMTCSCGATTGSVENKIADGVWGYWGDASVLLTAVNNHRANNAGYGAVDEWGNPAGWVTGLPALDNSLGTTAESIAIMAAQTNSYTATGVCAGGSAQEAVSSWVGQGLMTRDSTRGGVACLNKSNGDGTYTTIWVLVIE